MHIDITLRLGRAEGAQLARHVTALERLADAAEKLVVEIAPEDPEVVFQMGPVREQPIRRG